MFFLRHKFVLLGLIVTLSALQVPSAAKATNFSISLDGLYDRRLSGDPGHNNACGAALNLQFHPADFISLGASLDTLLYWGTETPNPVLVESVNLTGRFIFNYGDPFTLFLALEGGINPKLGMGGLSVWSGDFQATGGLGGWLFLNSTTAVNMMAGYNFIGGPNTPTVDPWNNLHGRLGITFFLSPAQKAPSNSVAEPQTPAAPAPAASLEPSYSMTTADGKPVEIKDTESAAPNSKLDPSYKMTTADGKPIEIKDTESPASKIKKRDMKAAGQETSPEISKIDQLKDSAETAEDKQAKSGEAESAGEITPPPAPSAAQKEPEYLDNGKLTEYSVQRRDTLWGISGKGNVYGNHFAWPLIFKANRDVISDPDLIYPEQNFHIGRDFSDAEMKKALEDSANTPAYVPHTKPREVLPVDYF